MWPLSYFAKFFWGQQYWPQSTAIPAVTASNFGGSYPPQRKKKKRKEHLPSFIPLGPSARESMLAVLGDIQERQDEEDLIQMLMNGMLD